MKLSIVTINYNNCIGLQKTIDSVCCQALAGTEFIVIDGGSTDGSLNIIVDNNDIPTYWVSEPDKGVYDAMNKGIDAASGEYCIFMNSGDCFYSSDVVSTVFPLLDGTDIIYGNTHYTDGKIRLSKNEPDLLSFLMGSCYCHQSTFIRTELLKKYHYDDRLKIVSDWKFYLQTLILNNGTFKAIDVDVSLYDATGISSTNKELYLKEREQVLAELFPVRLVTDYKYLLEGKTLEDRLYVEIKHSKLHSILYSLNVLFIRFATLFSKGSFWAKKYPIRLRK